MCAKQQMIFDLELVNVVIRLFRVFFQLIEYTKNVFGIVEPDDYLSLHSLKVNIHLLQMFNVLLAYVNHI